MITLNRDKRYRLSCNVVNTNGKGKSKGKGKTNGKKPNPLRVDPSRTGPLRRKLERELRKRFSALKVRILKKIVDGDALGLDSVTNNSFRYTLIANQIAMHEVSTLQVDNCGGVGSGVTGPCPAGPPDQSKPDGFIKRMGGKLSALADKIPVVKQVKNIANKIMSAIHNGLTSRYGEKTANAVMVGGFFGGYGVAGAAMLATGTPGIPFLNDIVAITIGTAIAEVKHQVGKITGKGKKNSTAISNIENINVELTTDQLKAEIEKTAKLIRYAMDRVMKKYGKDVIDSTNADTSLKEELSSLSSQMKQERIGFVRNSVAWNLGIIENAGDSFFGKCERDDRGRCVGGGEGAEDKKTPQDKKVHERQQEIVGSAYATGLNNIKLVEQGKRYADTAIYHIDKAENELVTQTNRNFASRLNLFRYKLIEKHGDSFTKSPEWKEVVTTFKAERDKAVGEIKDQLGRARQDIQSFKQTGKMPVSAKDEQQGFWEQSTKGVDRFISSQKAVMSKLLKRLGGNSSVINMVVNAGEWANKPDAEKLKSFQQWLAQQIQETVAGRTEQQLWERYVMLGMEKGAGRAFDDVKPAIKAAREEGLDFYRGSRNQFLEDSFRQPVAVEKVQLLASRSFNELEGITNDMATRMTRSLSDSLVQGKGAKETASDLVDAIDISSARAETIARTEIVRAHAEGQLMAMDQMGVEEVGVAVEWSTAGDDKVCDLCAPLEGIVLTLEEAQGMLPRHPNCRCAWIPANVGEPQDDSRKDTKRDITDAISSSIREAGGRQSDSESWGAGKQIEKERPESIIKNAKETNDIRKVDIGIIDMLMIKGFITTNCGGTGSGIPGPCPNIPTADRPKGKDGLYLKMETLAQAASNPQIAQQLRSTLPKKEVSKFDSAMEKMKGTAAKVETQVAKAVDTVSGKEPLSTPSGKSLQERRDIASKVISSTVGQHNLVSLATVREGLSKQGIADRKEQDEAIHQLRREGKITLSGLEGRHGASEAERSAAVPEKTTSGTQLLGYVSLRQ